MWPTSLISWIGGPEQCPHVILTQDCCRTASTLDELNKECCASFDSATFSVFPRRSRPTSFCHDFIGMLDAINARTDVIFGYELSNELFFDNDRPPFSLTSGLVTAANFKTYDMSLPGKKDQMIAEAMPYWINSIRGTIHFHDPTALVTVGFPSPHTPSPGDVDQRLAVSAAPAIWDSMADFIDLHTYRLPADPNDPLELMKQEMEEFGMIGMLAKPIILGEFGAEHLLGSFAKAALHLAAFQVESCQFGFDGWLLWTWDLTPAEDPNNKYYTALDGQGAIDVTLAPVTRPDPCSWE
jgi:hypothetical protein